MSTYPVAHLPDMGAPACGDVFCTLDICIGVESHGGPKKPWYMTVKPTLDASKQQPDPILLMKMDGWVLEKYTEKDKESSVFQYCPSMQWKKDISITEIRAGYCDACCEAIPEEIVAAFTMHNWNMLQKYDADMKKYSHDPYAAETGSDPHIEVFR